MRTQDANLVYNCGTGTYYDNGGRYYCDIIHDNNATWRQNAKADNVYTRTHVHVCGVWEG